MSGGLHTVHRLNSVIAATIKSDGMLAIVEEGLARQRAWEEQFLRAAYRGQWIGACLTLCSVGIATFLGLQDETVLAGTLFVTTLAAIVGIFAWTHRPRRNVLAAERNSRFPLASGKASA